LQKEQQAQRGQHHRREDDAERGPGSLPARRQSRKLLLNDLKIGFDRGEIGARLIRLPDERPRNGASADRSQGTRSAKPGICIGISKSPTALSNDTQLRQ
jgi:hypothetical protein